MADIKYLSFREGTPASGYWDQALLADILADPIFKNFPDDGLIGILPAAYQAEYINEINNELSKYPWALVFLTSDEESVFPVDKLKHKRMLIYVQYPKRKKHDKYRKWPLGYTSETRKNLYLSDHHDEVFFSGQITHDRRRQMLDSLKNLDSTYNKLISETYGFSQGLKPDLYMRMMCSTKVCPAPSGPISADSFRLYEALEAGAIPIGDNVSLSGDYDYWRYLFEDVPFPTIEDWDYAPGHIEQAVETYPASNNRVQAWWIQKKNELKEKIISDLEWLSDAIIPRKGVTVIIPVSPIKSHPNIRVLEETIKSIRYHLPNAPMIITFDGVRPEQEKLRKNYEEFIRRALFHCNTDWNAIPIIFDKHTHQVGMAKKAMELVKTPTILYCEQDTPLVTDEPIEWAALINNIEVGHASVIRFHFESTIPDPHKHMMIYPVEHNLLKTIQWSQRPHLASSAFYRFILSEYFTEDAKCFIEDKIHGICQEHYWKLGMRGWDMWKLFIYHPNNRNIKRSLHLDGREGEQKYDDTQVW